MENHGSKKLTMGRRKIEMKIIQKKTSLQVTFTKRRSGLFKKASELSILCGSELAIIVQSPSKKVYAFGSPSVESVLHRFEMGASFNTHTSLGDDVKSEYEEAVGILKEKKVEQISAILNHGIKENDFWWDQQIEEMEPPELEEYLKSLEDFRKNISCRIEEMENLPTFSSPSSVLAVPSQGSMEDTVGGLLVQNNNQELGASNFSGMKKDDGAHGCSNLGMNPTYGHDSDDFLFKLSCGNSSAFSLEAFLGGF